MKIDKYNAEKIAIFCNSAKEKREAILFLKNIGFKSYNNTAFLNGSTFKEWPYIYINTYGLITGAKILHIDTIKFKINFSDLKIKIYIPKWKKFYKN